MPRVAPSVRIYVELGGIALERTVAWKDRVRVRRELLEEIRAALDEHEELRPRVTDVPGGHAIPYEDDIDVGGRRHVGGFGLATRCAAS